MVSLTCDAFQIFFFYPISLSFCCAPDSFILFPLPVEHFIINIIQVKSRGRTWQEKNHTAEYSMPVAYTLNSASSSTLPNFDPLSFHLFALHSSQQIFPVIANLSSDCDSLYILETATFSPCRWFLLSAIQWKTNRQMAPLFSFSPANLSTYPFLPLRM